MRFGKGWEGKISLNMGQENICPQLSLAHCLPHGTITGPRILAGMAPASHQYGICHVLVGVVPPAPCPRQTLPSGRCRHNHTESGAELGKNRNMIYFLKSCYSNVSEFLRKLYIHYLELLGKPQPKSILNSGKLKDDSCQLAKQFSSFFNSHKSFSSVMSQCPSAKEFLSVSSVETGDVLVA